MAGPSNLSDGSWQKIRNFGFFRRRAAATNSPRHRYHHLCTDRGTFLGIEFGIFFIGNLCLTNVTIIKLPKVTDAHCSGIIYLFLFIFYNNKFRVLLVCLQQFQFRSEDNCFRENNESTRETMNTTYTSWLGITTATCFVFAYETLITSSI